MKKKKFLSAVLSAVMMFSVFSNFVFADSESKVFEITTAQQLAELAGEEITGSIELLADVDMSETEMLPIASLKGEFDGNGYTLSNLKISESTTDTNTHTALIGTLDGTVRDLVLENPSIELTYTSSYGGPYVSAAIVAGYAEDGEADFINVAITGENAALTFNSKNVNQACGALIGYANSADVTISGCYSSADVSGYGYRGGLVGFAAYSNVDIKNTVVTGSVSPTSTYYGKSGGFIGNVTGGSSYTLDFENCAYTGTASGSQKYGFAYIAGKYSHPVITVTNCWYDNVKNVGSSSYSPFELFPSSSSVSGAVTGTDEVTADMLGTAFSNDCLPIWYTSLDEEAVHTLTVTVTPAEAAVTLADENGTAVSGDKSENIYTFADLNGKYTCTVGGVGGYEEISFPIYTGKTADIQRNISLKEKTYEVIFDVTPAEADFTLFGNGTKIYPESGNTYSLKAGVYQYTAEADGYTEKSGTINVTRDRTFTITLTEDGISAALPDFLDGSGTAEEPYLIQNKYDLIFLAKSFNEGSSDYVKANFRLTTDIDLEFTEWEPIGKNYVYGFDGVFDGGNHTISGLNVDNTDMYCGLFGCLKDAEIKNLTVGGSVYSNELHAYVGGIAGRACGNTKITNSANTAVISASATASVGGLVGYCNKNDDETYQWTDQTVSFVNCYNSGDIVISGEDTDQFSEGLTGGIAGYSKNCVCFENCLNAGNIYAANIAAGICGNTGSRQGDNCAPYFKNCLNTGKITSDVAAFAIYGKGTLAESGVVNCFTAEGLSNDNVTVKTDDELKNLATILGNGWEQSENHPVPSGVEFVKPSDMLVKEAAKYSEVVSLTDTEKEYSFLKNGETADEDIAVQSTAENSEYISAGENGGVKLIKANDTLSAMSATVKLTFTSDGMMFKKTVSAIAPAASGAREAFTDTLAGFYASKSVVDEWAVFDMEAYALLKPDGAKVLETAKQNYINKTINTLSKSTALVTDRAKGEIILSALGKDTTKLYAVNSVKPFNNAELLKKENTANTYSNALWTLLADMQGNTKLSETEIQTLIDFLASEQEDDGLYHYKYGEWDFPDPDSTGWILASVARFVFDENDTYGVREKASAIADNAVKGLSESQGENGSLGNVYTDAMVITGLTAYGIDPQSDARFVKNNCSLADALMLSVNESRTGFVSAYSDGKVDDSATEQGFRALVSLAGFNANGKNPYNIYSFNKQNDISVNEIPQRLPAFATGTGSSSSSSTEPDTDKTLNVSVSVTALDSTWLKSTSVKVNEGSSVYHALKKAFDANDITADGLDDGYIKSITAKGQTLAQFDKGTDSGWLYYVNGETPSVGIKDYELEAGDVIEVKYTADYKQESGYRGGGSGSSSSKKEDENKDEETKQETVTWKNIYDDVSENDWFFEAVKFNVENNLFTGISDNEFAPQMSLTRGMFVTVIYRAAGEPESGENQFTDVMPGSYYEKAVSWAVENGIVNGVSENEFAPDENITREQIAVILYNYANGKTSKLLSETDFSDVGDVSEWASEAVLWAVENGIITGRDNMIAPKDIASRAEAAAMIMRFMNLK